MAAWSVKGIELPFGDRVSQWWVDGSGALSEKPIDGAAGLPGGYILSGLVDAHSHPAVGPGPSGPKLLTKEEIQTHLLSWAESGITLVRDVGSPAGVTLQVGPQEGGPELRAAGRFLAPPGRYFEDLLVEPVSEDELVEVALEEVRKGATWVKVISDFPRVPEFTDTARTYPVELIGRLCSAAHDAGARVAAHCTLPGAGELVAAGVDSIEHGPRLDEATVVEMGRRGVAWTPTLCALFADRPDADPEAQRRVHEAKQRLSELLPLAVRHGVPVMTGTDIVGSLPKEVALLSELGLEPSQALAAASIWPRAFIALGTVRADIVTYDHDPREDPAELAHPRAVVVAGRRVR